MVRGGGRVAKERGIFSEVAHASRLSVPTLIERVLAQRQLFEAKYSKKRKQEDDYYQHKTYKVEG